MKSPLLSLITVSTILCLTSISGFAGQLDDYYLRAFGQSSDKVAGLSAGSDTTAPHCGMPLKHGLSRDWSKLEPTTQKLLAKQLALPSLTGSDNTVTSTAGHFVIHYTTSGTDAPDITKINQYTGLGLTTPAGWAAQVAEAFEYAYATYKTMGYDMPPNTPYPIYLVSLAPVGEYGDTQDIQRVSSSGFPSASSSFIQIDKDFTNSIYKPGTYSPLQSLQITSAHEFHHAIQYGYNYYFDIWFAEATSTWFEDELYDSINQNYSYLPQWFRNGMISLDAAVDSSALSTGAGYGRWIFNRYLAENHSPSAIKSVWEALAPLPSPDGSSDIPMAPVLNSSLAASNGSSLPTDFFGFAKRAYTRNWSSHTDDVTRIPSYAPVATYTLYPVNSASLATPSVTLPHYSFAYYKFTPSNTTLSLFINKTSGIRTALFKKVAGTITELTPSDQSGTMYSVAGFSTMSSVNDEVVLLITNSSDSDNQQANFSTDGTVVPVTSGSCGTANGQTYASAPSTNLCSVGSATALTGSGPWTWACSISGGADSPTCSALKSASGGPTVSLGAVKGEPGRSVTVPITLTTATTNLAALSVDIAYDPTLLSLAMDASSPPRPVAVVAGPVATAAAKSIVQSIPFPGTLRIGILNVSDNTAIGDGVVATVTFSISASATIGGSTILLNTPGASDPAGNAVQITGVSSYVTFAPVKPGDCDGNGVVSISEVQSAVNMFLGVKPVQACADPDANGVVSISEVQKAINGFLGL